MFPFNFEITKHKNHAIEIVKTAIKKGYKNVKNDNTDKIG